MRTSVPGEEAHDDVRTDDSTVRTVPALFIASGTVAMTAYPHSVPASVVLLALLIVPCAAVVPLTLRFRRQGLGHAAQHEGVLAPN